VADGGAYPLLSPRVLFAAAVTAAGPYRAPDVDIVSTAAFTNTVPSSAMRGFGAMQVAMAYEAQMDRLAEAVGVSQVEIRRRNFNRQGDLLPTGEPLDTYVALPETLEAALDGLGPASPGPNDRNGKLVGRGFACNFQPYGRARFFADSASCWLSIEPDGSLTIRAGVTDLGGGQAASLAQIASEVLGVPVHRITVHIADSALTPLTGGTFATRQLYMSGNAVLTAARELRDQLAPVAADLLAAGHGPALEFAGGEVRSSADGPSVSLADLALEATRRGIMPSHLGTFHAETGEFDPRSGQGKTFPDYTYGTHAAEVEVDPATGQVSVRRYVACHDVGRAINPLRVEGQIQGGVAQGIGYALSEEIRIVDGTNLTGLFADYLVPVATDLPDIDAIVLELGEGKGPFGARGIGEPAISPCAATIASAVADAIGVRLTTLPITAERVLEALDSRNRPGSISSPGLG
jgi:xanthine dehydrogenase molybdenum-binding subunit